MKKVSPSKTWTPPANPQPKQEEKEEEQEKRKEEKPGPKTEAGKMLRSGDPSKLTSRNFPGASGQDIARGGKDLALLGVCILTGEEKGKALNFEKWDPKVPKDQGSSRPAFRCKRGSFK